MIVSDLEKMLLKEHDDCIKNFENDSWLPGNNVLFNNNLKDQDRLEQKSQVINKQQVKQLTLF